MIPGTPLPVVLSVPHGGTKVPPELKHRCRLGLAAILRDGDTWARHLFDFEEITAEGCVDTEVARAVVDMNRSPEDLPPANPDGVVKISTVLGEPVWQSLGGLTGDEVRLLLEKYHRPYHRQIARMCEKRAAIRLGLDCHTMLAQAPPEKGEEHLRRPLICLSNLGDDSGEPDGLPVSAPPALLRALQHALERVFESDPRFAGAHPDVVLNRPFRGGFIVKNHSAAGEVPWIQVEFNRSLYLPAPFPIAKEPDPDTAGKLRSLGKGLLLAVREVL